MRSTTRCFLLLLVWMLWLTPVASGIDLLPKADECADEVCPIPTINEQNQPVYAVVSPVGYHAVDMIAQAPRLDSLEEKKNCAGGRKLYGSCDA